MDLKATGRIIKRLRESRRLSQEVLSGLANVDRSHLSKIELGLRSPTITVFHKLAEALEIKSSELFKAIEDEIEKESRIEKEKN